jgi:hypothetical protein
VKKRLVISTIFLAFLIYFVWNSSWHLPSQLIIKGQTASPLEVRVNWDSGSGFNDMESEDLVFGKPMRVSTGSGVVRIRRVGKSHPAAKSAEVWVKVLKRSQDEHPMDLKAFTEQKGIGMTAEGYLHLQADGSELRVPAGSEYMDFCFVANKNAGFVEIDLDGDKRLYDLYAEQPQDKWLKRNNVTFAPGEFTATVSLPRYDIKKIQIEAPEGLQAFRLDSATIVSQKGELALPVQGKGLFSDIIFSEVPRNTKQFFHPIQFIQQLGFASLCTYILLWLLRFIRSRGGVKNLLIGEKRISFWLMFSGAFLCFSFWLLAYWPGHVTTDSIHIWWAAKNPGYFLHEHPFMNILYYRFLQQIWDHFAVVGLFQIFATSLLGSYIFYHLYKNGLPLISIVPFYLWFITSVPIGLYNVTLWKDIPFALIVVFWAYYFVRLRLTNLDSRNEEPQMGFVVLIFLLLCASLFRYNGLIYLILIPLGLAVYQRIALKKIAVVSLTVLLITVAGIFLTSIIAKHDFVLGMTKKFAVRLIDTNFLMNISNITKIYPNFFDDQNKYTWYRDDRFVKWHNAFTKDKKYNDFVKYQDYRPKSEAIFNLLSGLLRSSHTRPYVWLSWNPFYLLYLFLLGVFYKWFPLVSAYGYVLLTQTFFILMFLLAFSASTNFDWRYNYYLYLSGFFLIPLIMLDIKRHWQKNLMNA